MFLRKVFRKHAEHRHFSLSPQIQIHVVNVPNGRQPFDPTQLREDLLEVFLINKCATSSNDGHCCRSLSEDIVRVVGDGSVNVLNQLTVTFRPIRSGNLEDAEILKDQIQDALGFQLIIHFLSSL